MGKLKDKIPCNLRTSMLYYEIVMFHIGWISDAS